MKLIYLAHPYGGKPENVCKGVDLGAMLQMEYEHLHIFNAVYYFCKYKGVMDEEQIMRMCLDMVGRCEELWVAPGWRDSPGCKAEIEQATRIGIRVKYLVNIKGE